MITSIFQNKKVLVTGHTGFKGAWLAAWLKMLGAQVTGLALNPKLNNTLYTQVISNLEIEDIRQDIRARDQVKDILGSVSPDFVFHLAAQSLVGESFKNPHSTITTNAIGTVNLLEAISSLDSKVTAIFITSDKAYENREIIWGYRETDRLGGSDPYSCSKGMAELAIKSYFHSFIKNNRPQVRLAIARAGNVIGGGDWSEGRIIPDCFRAWRSKQKADIRSPDSTRPWQHVLEPLRGYLSLAQKLDEDENFNGEPFNFGPTQGSDHSVRELVEAIAEYWPGAEWESSTERNPSLLKESCLLKLDSTKAQKYLGWSSILSLADTAKLTAEWYKRDIESPDSMLEFTRNQISTYEILCTKPS